MTFEGVLTKMETEFSQPVQYYLVFENDFKHKNLYFSNYNILYLTN